MPNGDDRDIGFVSQSGYPAMTAPTFIIEYGGAFYVAAAVLEYDPRKAQTQEEQEGVKHVARLFGDGRDRIPAVMLDSRWQDRAQATSPQASNIRPPRPPKPGPRDE